MQRAAFLIGRPYQPTKFEGDRVGKVGRPLFARIVSICADWVGFKVFYDFSNFESTLGLPRVDTSPESNAV